MMCTDTKPRQTYIHTYIHTACTERREYDSYGQRWNCGCGQQQASQSHTILSDLNHSKAKSIQLSEVCSILVTLSAFKQVFPTSLSVCLNCWCGQNNWETKMMAAMHPGFRNFQINVNIFDHNTA
jgi:hypothetical protein